MAYVGPFRFPWGQACSRRVHGIASSLAAGGYDVVVASGEEGPAAPSRLAEVDGPGSVSHLGLGELPSVGDNLLSKSAQVILWSGRTTLAWLDAQATKPSHVIVYGGGTQYMVRLRRWCRGNRVPLIADVVEWHSPRQLIGGLFGPIHIGAKIALRYHYPRCDGVIAISSFLEGHYRERGCRAIRVPPTLDVLGLPVNAPPGVPDRSGLTVVYAGTPGRKDLLANVIHGVDRVARAGGDVRLHVVGPSPAEVRRLLGAPPPSSVRVLGRLPQPDVSNVLRQADFSVLLRRPARFAQAGFPTKFCESLANGIPVIANLTSDLGRYLNDGVEGIVCVDHSAEALAVALGRALRLSAEERTVMRKAARERALESFDFRTYATSLSGFLEEVRA
ncbi:glycosyltransferase [Plantactinospora mayteni]|uniref:LPS biosynthesis protein n=1 Tax=Plantactinospora mayteni TaxID=566021 RepID=A0ABQ4EGM0_9ACTN|nr:glycosyltransferase [Plantactinospora mayteni]GIG93879.1 LPS biosynthesis protein [Plantactinospora mayteni]